MITCDEFYKGAATDEERIEIMKETVDREGNAMSEEQARALVDRLFPPPLKDCKTLGDLMGWGKK